MNKRLLTPLGLFAALALTLSACGSSDGGETKGGGKLIKADTLTVCADIPYAPFEDYDKGSDIGYKGFDIDIDKYIAKELGLKLEVKKSAFDSLQSGLALNSGDCDLVSSAMTITDERAKKVAFSAPYYASMQSLLVPEGSPIKSINDLNGKEIFVQKATTGASYAKEHAKGAKITEYDDDGAMFLALKGNAKAAILQDLPVNLNHEEAGGYKIVETYDTGENYGLAMKKTNTKLVKEVDEALAKMKSSGDYQKVYDQYFKTGN